MKMTEKFNVIAMVKIFTHRTLNSQVFMLIEMTYKGHAPNNKLSIF